MCACRYITCGGQRTAFRSWFFPATMRIRPVWQVLSPSEPPWGLSVRVVMAFIFLRNLYWLLKTSSDKLVWGCSTGWPFPPSTSPFLVYWLLFPDPVLSLLGLVLLFSHILRVHLRRSCLRLLNPGNWNKRQGRGHTAKKTLHLVPTEVEWSCFIQIDRRQGNQPPTTGGERGSATWTFPSQPYRSATQCPQTTTTCAGTYK